MADRQIDLTDSYLEKLKKLVPTEVSAAFLAINSLVPFDADNNIYVYGFFALLVAACWLYLRNLQSVSSVIQLAFTSLVAFPVWALNIAALRFDWMSSKSFIPGCILIIVTVFSPLIYQPVTSARV
jgi:hypothetical protein